MPMLQEEYTKDQKDKEQAAKFKVARNGLKISLSKFLLEPENRDYEKLIESFIGIDPATPSKRERSFWDDLINIGVMMDQVFTDCKGLEDAHLVHKLTTFSLIQMDRVSDACLEAKVENFPRFKEKFDMGLTEDQESKSVIPKTLFYSIKLYLDRYYLLFRLYSINVKAKNMLVKISKFRDAIINFEYNIAYYMSLVKRDYIKDVVPFKRDMKITLMRLRKLFEAIDASNFGKLVKALYGVGIENGIKVYIKQNPEVFINKPQIGLTGRVCLASILEEYERNMFPISQIIAEQDTIKYKNLTQRSSTTKETPKAFWDFLDRVHSFRDGMHKVFEDIGKGVISSDSDYKYFIQTVQTVILPYVSQSRGEINDTFTIGINNLDLFFWKLMVKIIENAQEKNETIDEIFGFAIKVTDRDRKAVSEALKALKENKDNQENTVVVLEENDEEDEK